jgi:hypothetical protein
VVGVGTFFVAAPHLTMDVLAIRPSAEAAALFRLYGVLLIARGLLRHAVLGVRDPRVIRRGLAADLAFSLPSALLLMAAIRSGLAGGTTWWVVALFLAEVVMALAMLVALGGAKREPPPQPSPGR